MNGRGGGRLDDNHHNKTESPSLGAHPFSTGTGTPLDKGALGRDPDPTARRGCSTARALKAWNVFLGGFDHRTEQDFDYVVPLAISPLH